jgi:hemerythrin-like domain-containing protein
MEKTSGAIFMRAIHSYLSSDHRHCDETLANLEGAVSKNKWDDVEKFSNQFIKEMQRHFTCEESVLFPAFEEKTGMSGGPTMVMRMEHIQMKDTLGQLPEAVSNKNGDRILGITETLMIFIQQHNNKEEQMLYNMCDMHLSAEAENLVDQMKKVKL